MQDIIKTDDLYYKSKRRKNYNFTEYSLSIVFLRDIGEGYLLLKDADDEETKFPKKLKSIDKCVKSIKKSYSNITFFLL